MTASSRILLVDVDGTLLDSFRGIHDSFLEALADNGLPAPPEEQVRRIVGPPMADTLHSLGLEGSAFERTYASYRTSYTNHGWRKAEPVAGMRELLTQWRSDGFVLATATSKSGPTARLMLEHFGFLEFFDVVATASAEPEGRRSKKDVIGHALVELGIPLPPTSEGVGEVSAGADLHRRALMIGDRIHDVEGAKHFGVRSVLVDWGYGDRAEHSAADWSVADVDELSRVVANWADDRPQLCVVCTGNICRSPMGEIMLRQALTQAGLAEKVRLNSCGTTGWHVGEAADPRAVTWLQEHGYPATGHRAEEFGPAHRDADLFLVMDASHRRALEKAGVPADKIALFRSFGPAGDREVEDPYYGEDADFDRAGGQISEALPGIVDHARVLAEQRSTPSH